MEHMQQTCLKAVAWPTPTKSSLFQNAVDVFNAHTHSIRCASNMHA